MDEKCPRCHDTGIVKEENGQVHTCWDCLEKGYLDVHSKKIPDSRIKI
jgi:hypothetical protein